VGDAEFSAPSAWHLLCSDNVRAESEAPDVTRIELVAGDPDSQQIAISPTIRETSGQREARRLRDQLVAWRAIPVDEPAPTAALAPVVPAGC
jgi:hypothetical protein